MIIDRINRLATKLGGHFMPTANHHTLDQLDKQLRVDTRGTFNHIEGRYEPDGHLGARVARLERHVFGGPYHFWLGAEA